MTSFKTRQIRKTPPIKPTKLIKRLLAPVFRIVHRLILKPLWSMVTRLYRGRSIVVGSIMVLISVFVVFTVSRVVFGMIWNFDVKSVLFAAGEELKHDDKGRTNIVLLGDGGFERDGAGLIDTIIVASLDFKNYQASLLSIPRDFYVDSDEYGHGKINQFYVTHVDHLGDEDGFHVYENLLSEMLDIDVHYYMRVDFNAFVEIVDAMDGINVNVQQEIEDPYYPNDTDTGYTTFRIAEGLQELDGETALKFVRSRKTTSDFDRAARQQQVLLALKEKALSAGVLTSPSTLTNIYETVQSNMNTDMTLRELITMGEFAANFDRNNLVMKVLNDDPESDGGFMYVPWREDYDGLYVLRPEGDNYDIIRRYHSLMLNFGMEMANPVKIEVLNGSGEPGAARKVAAELTRYGFNVVSIDNYIDSYGDRAEIDRSFIQFNQWLLNEKERVVPAIPGQIRLLEAFTGFESVPSDVSQDMPGADLTLVVGKDHPLL